MILIAFHVELFASKIWIPLRPCRLPEQIPKIQKVKQKADQEMVPPPARPRERGVQGAQRPGKKKQK